MKTKRLIDKETGIDIGKTLTTRLYVSTPWSQMNGISEDLQRAINDHVRFLLNIAIQETIRDIEYAHTHKDRR